MIPDVVVINRILAFLLLIWSSSSLGHGPTPAALNAPTIDVNGPVLVRLSRGAALRTDDGFQYVCPSMWGGPDTPIMASPNGSTTWLPAANGIQTIDSLGAVVGLGFDEFSSSTVRLLLVASEHVIALRGCSGGSNLARLTPNGPEIVFATDTTIGTAIVHGDQILLGTLLSDGAVEIQSISMTGELTGPSSISGTGLKGTIALRMAGDSLYVRTANGLDYRLYRQVGDGLIQIAQSVEPIHGPSIADDTMYITVDRHLTRLEKDDTQTTLDTKKRVTCLGAHPNIGVYACVLPNIFQVNGDSFGPPLFQLKDLSGPPLEDILDPDTRLGCELEWLDFASDAGLPTTIPSNTVEVAEPTSEPNDQASPSNEGACATSNVPTANPTFLVITLLVIYGVGRSHA